MQLKMLSRVSIKAGVKESAIPINVKYLPENEEQAKVFLNRRYLYDMNLTVREAIAVLVILTFGDHLTSILNFFLSSGQKKKE